MSSPLSNPGLRRDLTSGTDRIYLYDGWQCIEERELDGQTWGPHVRNALIYVERNPVRARILRRYPAHDPPRPSAGDGQVHQQTGKHARPAAASAAWLPSKKTVGGLETRCLSLVI